MPDAETFLDRAAGTYAGSNLLWFRDPDRPEESAAEVRVEAARVSYTWQYEGAPQSGVLDFAFEGDRVNAALTDTWHSPEPMSCAGTHTPDGVTFLGTYGAGSGPDWSWRTELRSPAPGELLMEMYNIEPSGEEHIAVRLRATSR
jgi:hypothetical protein